MAKRTRRTHHWNWRTGLWITRAAVVLGAVAIGAGLLDLHLLLVPTLQVVAVATMLLSFAAIVLALWGSNRMSRRFREPIFWGSLLMDLALLGIVGVLYARSIRHPLPQVPIRQRSAAEDAP